jgi:hypothetical protein
MVWRRGLIDGDRRRVVTDRSGTMMLSLDLWNPDLLHLRQAERLAEIRRDYERRERLALAGYVPPAARLRAMTAGWLLRLALRLDERVAARAAATPPGLEMRTV